MFGACVRRWGRGALSADLSCQEADTAHRDLKARAAADLRTISNYVAHLVAEELKRKGRGQTHGGAKPGEKRRPYSIALYLTARERERLEAAAREEGQVRFLLDFLEGDTPSDLVVLGS
jgi:hypothetical protein